MSSSPRTFGKALTKRMSQNTELSGFQRITSAAGLKIDEEDHYTVKLEKKDGSWGIAYRTLGLKEGVVITAFVPESTVDEWNQNAEEEDVICVGDHILSVNSAFTSKEIIEELKEKESITMTLLKSGPRWHLHGVTADCLEKIAVAMDMGLYAAPTQKVQEVVEELPRMDLVQFIITVLAVALPNFILIACFSDMGIGLATYSRLAPVSSWYAGIAVIVVTTFFAISLYVVDWMDWKIMWQKMSTGIIVIYAYIVGGLIMCRWYPYAPHVICLFHVPVFLGVLRATAMKAVKRSSFYWGVTLATAVVGFVILGLWLLWMNAGTWGGKHAWVDATKNDLIRRSSDIYLNSKLKLSGGVSRPINYEWDCRDNNRYDFTLVRGLPVSNGYKLLSDELSARTSLCSAVKTIWFLVWVTPFISCAVQFIICVFCIFNGVCLNVGETSKLEKALKHFVLMIFGLVFTGWVAASISGASMRLTGAIFAFCGAGLLALFVWVYLEIGQNAITSHLMNSKIFQNMVKLATSDWVRACMVIAMNVLPPTLLLIDMLHQRVRKIRGHAAGTSWFTDGGASVLDSLSQWCWSSILTKANVIVILYWCLSIGVAKITYVFLSWLNGVLMNVALWLVVVLLFVIMLFLFLLPPTPGLPVYMICGLTCASRSMNIAKVGFWGGTWIGVALSFILKIASVPGQYVIGYLLGKNVAVQQSCGVDQVLMRAIEMILREKGMSIAKICIFVGGPDWPTFVLCGILKVSMWECIIGTLPIVLTVAPCSLAGSFMIADETQSVLIALSPLMLALAALGQGVVPLIATYYIQEVVYKHGEELAKPRAEHEAVAALTAKENAFTEAWQEVTQLAVLSRKMKALLVGTTLMFLLSLFMFLFLDNTCFRNFQLTNKIGDPLEEDGLGGNVLNLVNPLGWLALFLFFFAWVLHWIFGKITHRMAQQHLKQKEETPLPTAF